MAHMEIGRMENRMMHCDIGMAPYLFYPTSRGCLLLQWYSVLLMIGCSNQARNSALRDNGHTVFRRQINPRTLIRCIS